MCLRRPSAAQALVEFALVLPMLMTLTVGVLQLVLYAHARDVVLSSAQEGARLAAEDGRDLEQGFLRARTLAAAGLGAGLETLEVDGSMDPEVVHVRIHAALRPILPVPISNGLPVGAEAWIARERFRPGGA